MAASPPRAAIPRSQTYLFSLMPQKTHTPISAWPWVLTPALMFPPSPGQGTADPSTILASVIPPEHPKHFPVLRLHSAAARRTGHPRQGTDPVLIFFRIRLFKLCFSVCEMLWLSSRLKQWLCPPLLHLAQVTTVIQDVILIY